MPLPDHAFTVQGGCNCQAIRYKIEVPALNDRFLHPTKDQSQLPEKEKIRFPVSLVCHCNDCRKGSGSLLTYAFACLLSYVSFKFEHRDSTPLSETWIPAANVVPPFDFQERKNTFLEFYQSSERAVIGTISRSFCSRCGVSLTYNIASMPEPWPRFLDVWLGTIDREYLEKDWLIPERHCWVDVEIPWVGKLASEGSNGAPRHTGGSNFN